MQGVVTKAALGSVATKAATSVGSARAGSSAALRPAAQNASRKPLSHTARSFTSPVAALATETPPREIALAASTG